jgi:ammonia channel protein AmtB
MLLWNSIGAASIAAWSLVITVCVGFALNKLNLFRVPEPDEIAGLDFAEAYKEPAYAGPHQQSCQIFLRPSILGKEYTK